MIINKISLFNYGPFYDKCTIDFTGSVNGGSNIILIGGKNGSGKTTIFHALQICLYGKSALGSRTSQKNYEIFLKDQIHKTNSNIPITLASVEIDFDFSICGKCDNYRVKRRWSIENTHIQENLNIFKNGEYLDSFEAEYWQDFVKHLIPQGLLKLFFFDGERINSLTNDDSNSELADSVQTLFGLDVVRQLRADLRNFERKKIKTKESSILEKKLSTKESELKRFESEFDLCREKIAEIKSKIDIKDNEIRKHEDHLSSFGGAVGISRKDSQERIKQLQDEVEEKRKSIRVLYQKALPFYHAKEYLSHVNARIDNESKSRKRIEFKNEFETAWGVAKKKVRKLVKSDADLDKIFNEVLSCGDGDAKLVVHDTLSDIDIVELKRWFNGEVHKHKEDVVIIAKDIESQQRIIADYTKKLEHIPGDEDVGKCTKLINEMSKVKGVLEGKLSFEENRSKEINNKIVNLNREKEKIEEDIDQLASMDRRLNLVSKTIAVLKEFEGRLIEKKIADLEKNVLDRFSKLLRKKDTIKTIKIDPNNFNVALEDIHKRPIDKRQLSEGEKQVYAVSILSGITKTTKRSFPILFDTPLGRLDSDHRSNIIHNYFTNASHQLIILSTDTEIDKQYFNDLQPHIAKSYLLEFDDTNKRTSVKEGYFWS